MSRGKNYNWDFGVKESKVCSKLEFMACLAMYKNQKASNGMKRKFETLRHHVKNVSNWPFFGLSKIELEEQLLSNVSWHYNS